MIAAFVVKQRTPSVGDADSDEVALVTIFEPLEFASTAKAFRGGSLLCWYGGGDLDLRDATLDPAGAAPDGQGHVSAAAACSSPTSGSSRATSRRSSAASATPARPASVRPMRRGSILDGFAALGGFGIMSSRPEADIDVGDMIKRAKAEASDAADDATEAVTELVPALDV